MPYDPRLHNRRSIRLKGYDYAQAGAYFVTICAHQRARLFGCIENGTVTLSAYGQIVDRCWGALPRHFSGLTLDAYVLMPDHLHGIIVLNDSGAADDGSVAATMCGTNPGSLGAVIQNFKSISTRRVNQSRSASGVPLWQRDYYEHVIRDQDDWDRVHTYIAQNPLRYQTGGDSAIM